MGEKLVSRTQEGSKLKTHNHLTFQLWKAEREVIPVFDSLGKETTFIGLYTSGW